ncbi:hypothetical protein D9M69_695070 [compost metagenome]
MNKAEEGGHRIFEAPMIFPAAQDIPQGGDDDGERNQEFNQVAVCSYPIQHA